MVRALARGVFQYPLPPRIISYAAVAGKKEGEGPMGACFDRIEPDAHFGQETWEKAESTMQRQTVLLALEGAKMMMERKEQPSVPIVKGAKQA